MKNAIKNRRGMNEYDVAKMIKSFLLKEVGQMTRKQVAEEIMEIGLLLSPSEFKDAEELVTNISLVCMREGRRTLPL